MTALEVLQAAAGMPDADLLKIQSGITELMVSRFSPAKLAEIQQALEEGEAEIDRGEGLTLDQMRKALGHS